MAVTPLPQSDRFFAPEITKVYFVPEIGDIYAPTRAEIDAGVDLTGEIADWSGWTVASGTIDTPDLGSRFTPQIGGRTSAPGSSITYYADRQGVDVRTVTPRDTKGFILIADGGDVESQPCDIFPINTLSLGKVRSTSDTASQLTVQYSITREPAEDVELPA